MGSAPLQYECGHFTGLPLLSDTCASPEWMLKGDKAGGIESFASLSKTTPMVSSRARIRVPSLKAVWTPGAILLALGDTSVIQ